MSGRPLFSLLGMNNEEELESLYMQADFEEAVSARMNSMVDQTFKGKQVHSFNSLLSHLPVVRASERTFVVQNVMFHFFFMLTVKIFFWHEHRPAVGSVRADAGRE